MHLLERNIFLNFLLLPLTRPNEHIGILGSVKMLKKETASHFLKTFECFIRLLFLFYVYLYVVCLAINTIICTNIVTQDIFSLILFDIRLLVQKFKLMIPILKKMSARGLCGRSGL